MEIENEINKLNENSNFRKNILIELQELKNKCKECGSNLVYIQEKTKEIICRKCGERNGI